MGASIDWWTRRTPASFKVAALNPNGRPGQGKSYEKELSVMKIAPLFHAACAALLVLAALKTPAAAAERTWVSIGGADSNLCTRVSPCLTFQGAHDKTDPGGEINCLEEGSISSF